MLIRKLTINNKGLKKLTFIMLGMEQNYKGDIFHNASGGVKVYLTGGFYLIYLGSGCKDLQEDWCAVLWQLSKVKIFHYLRMEWL